jgi:DNA gyrase inhibitor GyrI
MQGKSAKFSVSPKLTVASAKHSGSYGRVGTTMRELKAWMDSKGIEQAGNAFCLYYDNPSETPEVQLRSEVCIPVLKPFSPEGRFQFKELSEVEVAETRHEGTPEKFAQTYGPFLESLIREGYRLLGPAREYYDNVLDVRGPGSGFLIQQPIARK